MNHKHILIAMMAMTAITLTTETALAVSGVVRGQVTYYNTLSTACVPTAGNSNCLGAYYTTSQQNTTRPLRNGIVYVVDHLNPTTVWGAGTTDSSGNFTVAWTHGTSSWVQARIVFKAQHSSGSFWIEDGGAVPLLNSTYFFLSPTSNAGSPQVLPATNFGSSAVPNEYANFYAGGEMAWANEFSQVNVLLNYMVTRLRFATPGHGTHMHQGNPGSGDFDNSPSRFDNWVIAHEMGHNADYRATTGHSYSFPGDYNYGSLSNGWHSFGTAEWAHAQFVEGFADFAAHASIYSVWSPAASAWGLNIESPGCGMPDANRTEGAVAGFLWDLYDLPNAPGESDMWRNIYYMYDVLGAYGGGENNNDKNEPYREFVITIDDLDGRSGYDYRSVAINNIGWSSTAVNNAYSQNCSVVGD